jgi:hypothetical protein
MVQAKCFTKYLLVMIIFYQWVSSYRRPCSIRSHCKRISSKSMISSSGNLFFGDRRDDVGFCSTSLQAQASTYAKTDDLTKGFVQGLTALTNALSPSSMTTSSLPQTRMKRETRITSLELLQGIKEDFANGYFWTGKINPNLYADDCRYTDPTISFTGLATFQRNIASITPLVDRFVGSNIVVLYDCSIDKVNREVRASWRMAGCIKLPWKPRIDITGSTIYRYSPSDGRIIEYYESWDRPALSTLLQAILPAAVAHDKLVKLASVLSPMYAYKPNSIAVSVKAIKDRIKSLALSVKKSDRQVVVKDQMNALINQLAAIPPSKPIGSVIPPSGSAWELLYTTAKGGSNGRIGPIYGEVVQRFGDNGSYANDVSIGSFTISLNALALPAATADTLEVVFESIAAKLFGQQLFAKPIKGQGTWKMRYVDDELRILDSNLDSIFILRKIY